MSNPLDPENDWKNKIARSNTWRFNRLPSLKVWLLKNKQIKNGIFYVEEEISITTLLKQFWTLLIETI